jgi:hypothetical protein
MVRIYSRSISNNENENDDYHKCVHIIKYIVISEVYMDTFDGGITTFSATATGTIGASSATEFIAVIIYYNIITLLQKTKSYRQTTRDIIIE